ncbi:MAG: DUF2283 domain-containing protein [Candidatus Harrisonbacteria bacterium]|nr:DUF2283 domain-containing protein [Candidatus Harrisonbacteria bacterium]
MKINYNKEVDALYIQLRNGKVYRTSEKDGNILVDFDKAGRATGIEVLHFSRSLSAKQRQEVSAHVGRLLIPV